MQLNRKDFEILKKGRNKKEDAKILAWFDAERKRCIRNYKKMKSELFK